MSQRDVTARILCLPELPPADVVLKPSADVDRTAGQEQTLREVAPVPYPLRSSQARHIVALRELRSNVPVEALRSEERRRAPCNASCANSNVDSDDDACQDELLEREAPNGLLPEASQRIGGSGFEQPRSLRQFRRSRTQSSAQPTCTVRLPTIREMPEREFLRETVVAGVEAAAASERRQPSLPNGQRPATGSRGRPTIRAVYAAMS